MYNRNNYAWERKSYDRVWFSVPKRNRDLIAAAAAASGESVNAFINRAVLARMGLTEWPDAPTPSKQFDRTPAPACVICGNPLPEGKLRYCSDACRRKGRSLTTQACKQRKLTAQSDE